MKETPFAVPINKWLFHDSGENISEILMDPRANIAEFLEPKAIRFLIKTVFPKNPTASAQIWALLILEVWLQEVLK